MASLAFFNSTGQVVAANAGALVYSIMVGSDGSSTVVVTLYHGTAATSGNEIFSISLPAVANTAPQQIVFKNPVLCADGVYASVTGTGGGGKVSYDIGG